jgi:hypothetical protein
MKVYTLTNIYNIPFQIIPYTINAYKTYSEDIKSIVNSYTYLN